MNQAQRLEKLEAFVNGITKMERFYSYEEHDPKDSAKRLTDIIKQARLMRENRIAR